MRYKYDFSLSSIYDDNFKNKYKIYPDDNKFSLGIGLTSRCNFSCPICYYHTSKNNNPYTDIPLELLKKIFIACPTFKTVNFALEGEPFCYPYVLDALDCAMDYAENIGISTNGSILNNKFVNSISKYRFSIFSFSIDGATEESYAMFRKGGNLSIFMNNVSKIVDRIDKNIAVFTSVIYDKNIIYLANLPKIAYMTGVESIYLMKIRMHDLCITNSIHKAKDKDTINFILDLMNQAEKYNIKIIIDSFFLKEDLMIMLKNIKSKFLYILDNKICKIPWEYTSILSNGYIFPCCGDFEPSPISEYTFDGIFNHDYMTMIRGNILKNKSNSFCNVCRNYI